MDWSKKDSKIVQEIAASIGLENLGYEQELYRGFNGWMAFSFCFTSVAVVTSVSGLFIQGLGQGGPAVLIWSWIFGTIFTVCTCFSLAEICSTYPSSGSVYHWAGLLASPKYGPFAAYVTGWFNCLGNTAGDAFFAWALVMSISATTKAMGYGELSNSTMVILSMTASFLWALQNLIRIDYQGIVNNIATFWQVLTTLAIVIVLLYGSTFSGTRPATAQEVFFTYYNNTGFDSPTYVVLIGILVAAYSFTGYEAGSHMAEETVNARTEVPKGIVNTGIATGAVGLVLLLGLLFVTANNIDQIVLEEWTITDIFTQVSGVTFGTWLSVTLTINMYFSGMSSLTTTARLLYAMSRDGAFPGSKYFVYVTKDTKIPMGAVWLTLAIDCILLSLNLFSETAFTAITSIATIGFQVSYLIPIFLRVTGYGKRHFVQHEYSLGKYSMLFGWISCAWLFFTSCLFLLPTTYPITIETISWAPIIIGGVCIVGGLYWVVSARHWFKGPIRLDHDAPRYSCT